MTNVSVVGPDGGEVIELGLRHDRGHRLRLTPVPSAVSAADGGDLQGPVAPREDQARPGQLDSEAEFAAA
jgi:hypothetical protein